MASARQFIARGLRTITRAVEGQVRPGPYTLPLTGGWLPDGVPTNWWQMGMDPIPYGECSAIVEACVSAYSQTIAMCPGDHWRATGKGGRERVKNSALSRILRSPNAYQTISDFLLNAVRQLYIDGNAYALALRNDRFEVTELHLMQSRLSKPMVNQATGDVFYRMGGNYVVSNQLLEEYPILVPQRDVLHIRLHADRRYPFPLWGISPLLSATSDLMINDAIYGQQINFYLNQARPAAVISTDMDLDHDQVQALQDRWDERAKGMAQGKTPVLTHGLKVMPWSVGGRDAQLAELLKFSKENIALVFRIPLAVLGISGGSTFGSTEALMQFWVSTGLGFALNHVEQAFDRLFQLKGQPDEYTEFSTAVLLRSAMKDRIEALKEGVMGGIYSPNEARNLEDLDSVPYGDSPRVQQQVVPLEAAAGIVPGAPGGASGPHPPPAPPAAGQPPAAAIDLKPKPPPPKVYDDDVKRGIRRIHDAAARAARRLT